MRLAKRRQLSICSHNETLPVAAMRINNPDYSVLRDQELSTQA